MIIYAYPDVLYNLLSFTTAMQYTFTTLTKK